MRPVPEYDAKAWLLKALRETAHAMEALLWDVEEPLLDDRRDDEWSCADLAWHMMEMERRYIARLERMVQMDAPAIEAFDGDSFERERRSDIFSMMDEFGTLRRQSVYLLWSLDDEDWQRTGIHPYLGPLTVLQVAREMSEHDLSHLWQLRRMCDALGLVVSR